jgi:hypothetical protein
MPDLGLSAVHAKIDTGATTSALHGEVIEVFTRDGIELVRFSILLGSRSRRSTHEAEAELLEFRRVKSSNGHYTKRPVVLTHVSLGGLVWPIELTLANRETMGMPMLLGRQSLKNRFLVNPGRSYLLSKKRTRARRTDSPSA